MDAAGPFIQPLSRFFHGKSLVTAPSVSKPSDAEWKFADLIKDPVRAMLFRDTFTRMARRIYHALPTNAILNRG